MCRRDVCGQRRRGRAYAPTVRRHDGNRNQRRAQPDHARGTDGHRPLDNGRHRAAVDLARLGPAPADETRCAPLCGASHRQGRERVASCGTCRAFDRRKDPSRTRADTARCVSAFIVAHRHGCRAGKQRAQRTKLAPCLRAVRQRSGAAHAMQTGPLRSLNRLTVRAQDEPAFLRAFLFSPHTGQQHEAGTLAEPSVSDCRISRCRISRLPLAYPDIRRGADRQHRS